MCSGCHGGTDTRRRQSRLTFSIYSRFKKLILEFEPRLQGGVEWGSLESGAVVSETAGKRGEKQPFTGLGGGQGDCEL